MKHMQLDQDGNYKMITYALNFGKNYHGLGDRLCEVMYARNLHLLNNKQPIDVHISRQQYIEGFENLFKLYGDDWFKFTIHDNHPIPVECQYRHTNSTALLRNGKDVPKCIPKKVDIDLPEKFIVCQFDVASQGWTGEPRRISPEGITKIKQYYMNQGYEIVVVGGESNNPMLGSGKNVIENIAYAMSKAELYAGTDSGMMHLASMILPTDRLHLYTKDVPKPQILDTMNHLLRKGAKLNYCWSKV